MDCWHSCCVLGHWNCLISDPIFHQAARSPNAQFWVFWCVVSDPNTLLFFFCSPWHATRIHSDTVKRFTLTVALTHYSHTVQWEVVLPLFPLLKILPLTLSFPLLLGCALDCWKINQKNNNNRNHSPFWWRFVSPSVWRLIWNFDARIAVLMSP